ncbi:hypothetical protein EMIT0111MI5_30198 [Burkholderia sp. IT-111MI5]
MKISLDKKLERITTPFPRNG